SATREYPHQVAAECCRPALVRDRPGDRNGELGRLFDQGWRDGFTFESCFRGACSEWHGCDRGKSDTGLGAAAVSHRQLRRNADHSDIELAPRRVTHIRTATSWAWRRDDDFDEDLVWRKLGLSDVEEEVDRWNA